jgi:predicted nucleic acid-binding protein
VSGLISRTGAAAKLIDALYERRFDIVVSEPVIAEYEVVLKTLPQVPRATAETLIDYVRQVAIYVRPGETAIGISRDASDDAFLACADSGAVRYLVTKNVRHFPKRYRSVETVRLGRFLKMIGL